MKFFSSAAAVIFCYVFSTRAEERVTLKIGQSKLIGTQGITHSLLFISSSKGNARTYYSFFGLPYAVPPLGENRWMDPKLLELTEPEYDATAFKMPCTQWSFPKPDQLVGSDDCLFVNVFTANLEKKGSELTAKRRQFPVMVYIHAGGYMVGGSNAVGPKFFMRHDVILVTLNYRLGVLGYLSTDNKNLPGNYGALDQVTALDWVQKYIHHFGGDPRSVTIFGHSAGAVATHMLTMSPRSLGKYHKAIIQSGSGLSSWAVTKPPKVKVYAQDFMDRVGCPQKLSDPELVTCLKKKSTLELFNAQKETLDFWLVPLIVNHVVDGETRGANAFLPALPQNIMDKGLYHKTPLMTGLVKEEGLMIYASLQLQPEVGNKFLDDKYFLETILPKIVRNIIPFGNEEHVPEVVAAVRQQYFPEAKLVGESERITRVSEIYGDSVFNSGNWDMLRRYGDKKLNTVYSFLFTHKGQKSPSMIWSEIKTFRKMGINHELFDSGITHVDDMYYLFDHCELFPSEPNFKFTAEDLKFADFITGVWSAFAKNGNPDEGIKRVYKGFDHWNPVKAGSVNYFNLTTVPASMGSNFRAEQSLFWKELLYSLD